MSLSKLTKYCACHEKWISWLILVTHETLFTMREQQQMASSNITEYCACHANWLWKLSQKFLENCWNVISNAGPIRAGSDHDPTMIRAWSEHETVTPQPASQPRLLFTPTASILYWKIQHFALRLSFQISPNTAPATKSDTSTSPNTAPATKSNTHHWSSSHMKRYLHCAATMIRAWSENETVTPQPASQPRLLFTPTTGILYWKYNISRSGYHSKFHQILRLPRKVTLQLHQILRLPRKVTLERHQIMHLPRKVTLERHQIVHLPRKVTLERHQIVTRI